jgi:alkaline phosphatase
VADRLGVFRPLAAAPVGTGRPPDGTVAGSDRGSAAERYHAAMTKRCRGIVVGLFAVSGWVECRSAAAQPAAAPAPAASAVDRVRLLQCEAEVSGAAAWGHWGDQPGRYVSWSNHSNRLIPVYTFGIGLDAVAGANSIYRDQSRLTKLYGRLPDHSLNPAADYFDQTDIYTLQLAAAAAGKKYIVLVVFDGMDWTLTRAAAIATAGRVAYAEGRGTGFAFQDYRGCPTDFGLCVTSPAHEGTKTDVDAQAVKNPGGDTPGGYDASRGGATAWDPRPSLTYLIGRDRDLPHAVTDSAASATALCTGRKTYNDAINVGPAGEQLVPVARLLQARGFAVGAISSVPIPHATPACAYANNVSRDDYQDISRDMLGEPSVAHPTPLAGLDVVIGAGFGVEAADDFAQQGRNYEPGNKYLAGSTLAAIDAANGGRYRVAARTSGRSGGRLLARAARDAAAGNLRLFGFFGTAQGNLPFRTADGDFNPGNCNPEGPGPEEDRLRKKYGSQIHYSDADVEENPTLAEMTTAALEVLGRRERFWLMVEAGDVDWACHANNLDTAIGAVQSGDAAFRAVVDWIERRDAWADAAVFVTSDHGHLFVLTEPEALAAGRAAEPTP